MLRIAIALPFLVSALACGGSALSPLDDTPSSADPADAPQRDAPRDVEGGAANDDDTGAAPDGDTPVDAAPVLVPPGGPSQCPAVPACDAAPPSIETRSFRHLTSNLVPLAGSPQHRGRDLLLNPGDKQFVLTKIAYGIIDKDLHDEDVELFLLRDCGSTWESLGIARTTDDDEHEPVEGVVDNGGQTFFEIPAEQALGIGRHRVHAVVVGDGTSTDLFIEVRERGTPVFVSDVDGTLTTSELAELGSIATGSVSAARPDAATVLATIADRGYLPFYLTARPAWLVERTRAFLEDSGFPRGLIHTTQTFTGNIGGGASDFKTDELALLAFKGIVPAFAFGNTETDGVAYEAAGIEKSHRYFVEIDDANGGTRINTYSELLDDAAALPSLCESGVAN